MAFQFSSTAYCFLRNPRKSIYGKKYMKDHYLSFVFFATRSPTCAASFVIPATIPNNVQNQHLPRCAIIHLQYLMYYLLRLWFSWRFEKVYWVLMPSYIFSSCTAFFRVILQYKYNTNTQIDKCPLTPKFLTTFGFGLPFLLVFCVFHQNCDHGDRQGNTVQTLTQRRYPAASSEALDEEICP